MSSVNSSPIPSSIQLEDLEPGGVEPKPNNIRAKTAPATKTTESAGFAESVGGARRLTQPDFTALCPKDEDLPGFMNIKAGNFFLYSQLLFSYIPIKV